jgi:pyridoxamine 5'-phosphate oxidase-like protein
MTDIHDLTPGGQAQAAWARPTRSKAERRAHVLRRLESEDKLWIATAADGGAHLVPFSFVWDGERVSMATAQDNPAARNVARTGKARLALGNISDIVLIDGAITVIALQALDDSLAERLSRVSAIDARRAPGYVYLQLTPVRIQVWWSAAELAHPTIMREGRWLAP